MPRLISPAAYITPHMPAKPHSSLAALPAPPLATDAKRHSQRRSRAGRNGKNAPYQNLRKRCEGSSAELSDMRRRGSSHARRSTPRGEEVVFNRRSIATRNAAKATGAAARGAGARPRPVAGATNTRGAMGGKFRRRQPGTPKPVAAGCAGLRPDGVYAYAKRSHGHAGRPSGTGRTVEEKLAAR